jgi:hypothetical protein
VGYRESNKETKDKIEIMLKREKNQMIPCPSKKKQERDKRQEGGNEAQPLYFPDIKFKYFNSFKKKIITNLNEFFLFPHCFLQSERQQNETKS